MSNEQGNGLRRRAQAVLPPGDQIRYTFLTLTGSKPVVLPPRGAKHWVVAVTDREFVVMRGSLFRPLKFRIAFKAPRKVLPIDGNLYAKIMLGSATHYVARGSFQIVRAQNAELEAAGTGTGTDRL